ncbi:hypothetical protein [Nocardia sp. CC201C]|uniref:hypothetical protein n=1 Tax=Nocardia sp. CC201C TaxID=3044575 RepID=UPI0024A83217|nr:hypothetical protein [Nocardia sp. CC201C]
MPARLAKPTDVPEKHAPLIEMLWRFYIAAGEPSMRKIADAVQELDEDQRKSTANHETVRKTLRAINLPQQETVELIFLALCHLADVDPDDIEPSEDDNSGYNGWDQEPSRSHREELVRNYLLARHGSVPTLPRTREVKARQEAEWGARQSSRGSFGSLRSEADPWGSVAKSSPDDEPPF